MTVKELIEKLQQLPQDLKVVVEENSTEYTPEYVYETENVSYDITTGEKIIEKIVYIH